MDIDERIETRLNGLNKDEEDVIYRIIQESITNAIRHGKADKIKVKIDRQYNMLNIHVEDNETEPCNCGNLGCLEEYASATGITRLANRALKASDKDSILRTGEVSAKAVFDAVKAGDALAIEVACTFGEYLGKGLGVIAGVINPEIFVIGGGVSKAGEILFDYIKPPFERTVFHGCKDTKFALATLGNDAGIYGAARMVLD